MNWGTRIFIFYSFFVVGILFLVIRSTFHTWDLVADDYYGEELKYESRMNAISNTGQLPSRPAMRVEGNSVVLNFPTELLTSQPSGRVKFYKPADKGGDFDLPIQLDNHGNQAMVIPVGKSGRYNAQLSWSTNDRQYYQEYSLFLP